MFSRCYGLIGDLQIWGFSMVEFYVGVLWYLVFLVSVCLHEAAHAFCARKLGDLTASRLGLAGLDPMPHIKREPFGMVVLPLLSLYLYGWPMGFAHIAYDTEWAAKYPRRSALMSLAGPGVNLMLALAAGLLLKAGLSFGWFSIPGATKSLIFGGGGNYATGTLASILSVIFTLNLVLGLFNLLPFPPLDGSGAVSLLLPVEASQKYQNVISQPFAGMIGLLLAWNIFPKMFSGAFSTFVRLTY